MRRSLNCLVVAVGLLCVSNVALAEQDRDVGSRRGCVNSPENPTLLLGLLGAAAAGVPRLRSVLRARRNKRNH